MPAVTISIEAFLSPDSCVVCAAGGGVGGFEWHKGAAYRRLGVRDQFPIRPEGADEVAGDERGGPRAS